MCVCTLVHVRVNVRVHVHVHVHVHGVHARGPTARKCGERSSPSTEAAAGQLAARRRVEMPEPYVSGFLAFRIQNLWESP